MSARAPSLPDLMPAARILRAREAELVEAQVPRPGPGQVLIRVERAGICGTDLHIWGGDYAVARYPLVPGHEFSGTVAAVGEGVAGFAPGDRVTADPNIPCERCAECRRNAQNQCLELEVIGVTRAGAFARYVLAPERVVFGVGDLPFEQAALVEPLACVVWGLKRVRVEPGDRALLFGAGPMGCLLLQAVRRAGAAEVVVVDPAPRRRETALRLGASRALAPAELTRARVRDLAPHGFELVVDATGVPDVISGMAAWARPRATLWVFGVAPEGATAPFSPFEVFRKDLSIVGSFALSKTFQESLTLVRSGAFELAPLVSHVVPLSEFEAGLELAERDPDRMKVQFDLGSEPGAAP